MKLSATSPSSFSTCNTSNFWSFSWKTRTGGFWITTSSMKAFSKSFIGFSPYCHYFVWIKKLFRWLSFPNNIQLVLLNISIADILALQNYLIILKRKRRILLIVNIWNLLWNIWQNTNWWIKKNCWTKLVSFCFSRVSFWRSFLRRFSYEFSSFFLSTQRRTPSRLRPHSCTFRFILWWAIGEWTSRMLRSTLQSESLETLLK